MSMKHLQVTSRIGRRRALQAIIVLALVTTLASYVRFSPRTLPPSAAAPTAASFTASTAEDLVDLLDVRSLRDSHRVSHRRNASSLAALRARSTAFAVDNPHSVIARYEQLTVRCAARPFRPHLLAALKEVPLISNHDEKTRASVRADSPNGPVLLVFCDGAYKTKKDFVAAFDAAVEGFASAWLLCYGHDGCRHVLHDIQASGKKRNVPVVVLDSLGAEADLKLTTAASHVLVHGDELAALAAVVSPATVFISEMMYDFAKNAHFRWMVPDLRAAIEGSKLAKLFSAHDHSKETFEMMGDVVSTCCAFDGYGKGDGEKVVCSNAKSFQRPSCWVLSVGCAGRFSFEQTVVERTACNVHVFDCTGDWKVPGHLEQRVTLHKLCLGSSNTTRNNFRSFEQIVQVAADADGLSPSMPAMAKMDIEGFEFPVFRSMLDAGKDDLLPDQMLVEVHTRSIKPVGFPFAEQPDPNSRVRTLDKPFAQKVFGELLDRGFSLVHRNDNPWCPVCTEVNLMRRKAFPEGA